MGCALIKSTKVPTKDRENIANILEEYHELESEIALAIIVEVHSSFEHSIIPSNSIISR